MLPWICHFLRLSIRPTSAQPVAMHCFPADDNPPKGFMLELRERNIVREVHIQCSCSWHMTTKSSVAAASWWSSVTLSSVGSVPLRLWWTRRWRRARRTRGSSSRWTVLCWRWRRRSGSRSWSCCRFRIISSRQTFTFNLHWNLDLFVDFLPSAVPAVINTDWFPTFINVEFIRKRELRRVHHPPIRRTITLQSLVQVPFESSWLFNR